MDTHNIVSLLDNNAPAQLQWRIAPVDAAKANALAAELNVSPGVAGLYLRLGLDTAAKVQEFNGPTVDALYSPWLLPDMRAAVERLNRALETGETIHVHGDYDVDGITATAIVVYTLRKLGATVTYRLPHRLHDGYGLQIEAVDRAKLNGATLLVSVDCGTNAHEAAIAAHEANIDLIVTDHHEPEPEASLPDCVAIVNPSRADSVYPFCGLSGAGVAFKTMLGLCERRKLPLTNARNQLLEFVALGTVADLAPLADENRVLVQLGLEQLRQTRKRGLRALLQSSGILDSSLLSSASIAFQIAPRLNAPGRVDDPQYALDLLLASDEPEARQGAARIEGFNRQRKLLLAQAASDAQALLSGESSANGTAILRDGVVVVASPDWLPGLLGPLASELSEKMGRPALAARICPDGTLAGSCRSQRDFAILSALKSPECRELLIRCGGHRFASGFALPAANLALLAERVDILVLAHRREQARQAEAEGKTLTPTLDFDGEFVAQDVTLETLRTLAHLAPFCEDRTQPLLLLRNLQVVRTQGVKKGEHLKLFLRGGACANTIPMIAWGQGADISRYPAGCRVDVAANLTCDTHDGYLSVQLQAQEIRFAGTHEVAGG